MKNIAVTSGDNVSERFEERTDVAGLQYEYDFTTMKDLSEFDNRYIWDRHNIVNNELQFYVDQYNADNVHRGDIITLTDMGLSITAIETPEHLKNTAVALSVVGRTIMQDRINKGLMNPLSAALIKEHGQLLPYCSAVLTTRTEGFSYLYGTVTVRCKLPSAAGAWPAAWLLPTFKKWPAGVAVLPEIDIMEGVGDVLKDIYHGSLHSNETGQLVSSKGNEVDVSNIASLTTEYHDFSLSWEPDFIIWYFNGIPVLKRATPADMHEPRHLLLNLAVGGWGGVPNPNHYPSKSSFVIKHVKFFESVGPEPVLVDLEDFPSDTVFILDDGRPVTRSALNLVTEYYIQLGRQASFIENKGPYYRESD
jgi:hypothetical protein